MENEFKNNFGPETETSSEFKMTFENVEILPDKPYEFTLEFKKEPLEIRSGDRLAMNSVEVVFDGPLLELNNEAAQLKELPEKQKIIALLDLIRSRLKYPYQEEITKLLQTNPDLGEWVNRKFGEDSREFLGNKVNDCLDKGYGDCKILSAAYLSAAQASGLKGVIQECGRGVLKNINNPNTGKPLFKMVEPGQVADFAHVWVDVQLESGEWIPVDATANIAGVTDESKEIFSEANYRTLVSGSTETVGLPRGLIIDWKGESIKSGEGSKTLHPRIVISKSLSMQTNQEKFSIDSFKGDIDFSLKTETTPKVMGVRFSKK